MSKNSSSSQPSSATLQPPTLTPKQFFTALVIGVFFGYFFERSQIWRPEVIQQQFALKDFAMLKFFLGTAASSCVALELIAIFQRETKEKLSREKINTPRGALALIIGGLLLGVGMYWSGSCPATVWVQIGARSLGHGYVLLGCFAGSVLFGVLFPFFSNTGIFSAFKLTSSRLPLPEVGGGLMMGSIMTFFAILTEYCFPHKGEWLHPSLCGVAVGMLQVPSALLEDELLGSTQAYITITAHVLKRSHLPMPAYFNRFFFDLNAWQTVMFCSVAVGSVISHRTGYEFLLLNFEAPASPSTKLSAFVGGVFLVFGSRFAAGCPTG